MRDIVDGQASLSQDNSADGGGFFTGTGSAFWQQYGLATSPFDDHASFDQFFEMSEWHQHLTQLSHFKSGDQPLLVMSSAAGAGKTSLLDAFLFEQEDSQNIHYVSAAQISSLVDLLDELNPHPEQFSQFDGDIAALLPMLSDFSAEYGDQLLIIDDADQLSRDTLIGLSRLLAWQDFKVTGFRVVLVGEPHLQTFLNRSIEQAEVQLHYPVQTLRALSVVETKAYLQHRLDQAGFDRSFPFNSQMVKQIHHLSGGYPGRINRVAQQVLVDAVNFQQGNQIMNDSLSTLWREHKIKFISVFLLTTLCWSLYQAKQFNDQKQMASRRHNEVAAYQQKLNTLLEHNGAGSMQPMASAIAYSEQKNLTDHPSRTHTVMASQGNASHIQEYRLSATRKSPAEEQALQKLRQVMARKPITSEKHNTTSITTKLSALHEAIAKRADKTTTTAVASLTSKQSTSPTAHDGVVKVGGDVKQTEEMATKRSAAIQQALTAAAVQANANSAKSPVAQTAKLQHKVGVKKSTPKRTVTTKVAVKESPDFSDTNLPLLDDSEDFLREAEGYTVQIMGAHDWHRLANFVERTGLSDNIAVYHTSYKKEPWYVLVFGSFKTPEQAENAVSRLPTVVQNLHPWVKPLSSVHAAIEHS